MRRHSAQHEQHSIERPAGQLPRLTGRSWGAGILPAFLAVLLMRCAPPANVPPTMPIAPEYSEPWTLPEPTPGQPSPSAPTLPSESPVIRLGNRDLLVLRTASVPDADGNAIACRITPRPPATQHADGDAATIDLLAPGTNRPPIRLRITTTATTTSLAVVTSERPPRFELAFETLVPMLPVCLTPRDPDRVLHAAMGPVAGDWFDGLFDVQRDWAVVLEGHVYCEEYADRVRLTVSAPGEPVAAAGHLLTLRSEPGFLRTRHGLTSYAPVDPHRLEPMPAAWMPFDVGEPPTADEIARNTIWMAVNLNPYGAASVLVRQPQMRSLPPTTVPALFGTGPSGTDAAARASRPIRPTIAAGEWLQRTAADVATRFWGQGLLAQVTSYTVIVGDPLSLEQARLFAAILGLGGRSPIAGERMYLLDDERVDPLRRIIPAAPVRAVDLFAHRGCPPVWNLAVAVAGCQLNVIGLFNTSDEPRLEAVELEDLHLGDGAERFAVYDVWAGRPLRVVTDRFQVEVPPTGCRVLSIARLRRDQPTLLGTNRHLTCGGVDLHAVRWHADALTLAGRSDVVGHEPYELRLHVPPGESGLEILNVGVHRRVRAGVRGHDQVRVVTFEADATGPVDWQVSFYRVTQPDPAPVGPPRNLATRQTTRGVWLDWYQPDERAVAHRLYRNQRLLAEIESCGYQDSTALYNSTYQYAVAAVDAYGNESAESSGVTHQTPMPASTNLPQLVPLLVAQERFLIGQDRSVTGTPLRIAGQRIYRGLGVAAPSRIAYILGAGYDTFTGSVGIDDSAAGRGSAVFRIIADGQTLFASPVMRGGQPPLPFTARVRGKTRLELTVSDADDGSDYDYAVWANPYLRGSQPEPGPAPAPDSPVPAATQAAR
ncbi:MAG: NPCBM/NEW2 domain-containing protein [Planctomycetes bacterium]|nr:NPCBM/NEW2 domain-containing protein [Planctomycetota bacterium]